MATFVFMTIFIVGITAGCCRNLENNGWINHKDEHEALPLSETDTILLANQVSMNRFWNYLRPILKSRPVGSYNHQRVAQHIVQSLYNIGGWQFEFDSFRDKPPQPYLISTFTNIVASSNPSATRKLVLACHYDSKIFRTGNFIGATDSAVPCAMMLEIAHVLSSSLKSHTFKQHQNIQPTLDVALELIFFDGEEAFVRWSDTDSLYGSRHLAAKWKKSNRLQSIDLMVLLDLVGAADTTFCNFFVTHSRWFEYAATIENRLKNLTLVKDQSKEIFPRYHEDQLRIVQDDHLPFLAENVSILHLISMPFPRGWHTVGDDEKALDRERIRDITQTLAIFVAEYLHLILV